MHPEQWKLNSAMSMIPDLTEQDIAAALTAAGLKLAKRRRSKLRLVLTVALHNYVVERLFQAQTRRRAKRKGRIIAPGKSREKRHFGDRALRAFFGELNGIWMDYFDKLPGVTWHEHRSQIEGKYIGFVESILCAYASKIPEELQQMVPGLRDRFDLTRSALHGRFRRTNISKLRHIVDRLSKETGLI